MIWTDPAGEGVCQIVVTQEKKEKLKFVNKHGDEVAKIIFPKGCVMGNRSIGLELLPKNQKMEGNLELMTPVLFVSQPRDTVFLSQISVFFPISEEIREKLKLNEWNKSMYVNRNVKIHKDSIEISTVLFSPSGIYFDRNSLVSIGIFFLRISTFQKRTFERIRLRGVESGFPFNYIARSKMPNLKKS